LYSCGTCTVNYTTAQMRDTTLHVRLLTFCMVAHLQLLRRAIVVLIFYSVHHVRLFCITKERIYTMFFGCKKWKYLDLLLLLSHFMECGHGHLQRHDPFRIRSCLRTLDTVQRIDIFSWLCTCDFPYCSHFLLVDLSTRDGGARTSFASCGHHPSRC
jgi:hypothetical protein